MVFDLGERHIWFTIQGGNFVGRLNASSRTVDLIAVPTSRARPYGINIAPAGTPWIVLLSTNEFASADPETLEPTEYMIPAGGARPRRFKVTRDGRIWYADYPRGYLGRYDLKARSYREWALPLGGRSQPYGMALDEDGRSWVVSIPVSRPSCAWDSTPDASG